jgi:hypothetical protein
MFRKFLFVSAVVGLTACSDEDVIPVERIADDYMPNTTAPPGRIPLAFLIFPKRSLPGVKKLTAKRITNTRLKLTASRILMPMHEKMGATT